MKIEFLKNRNLSEKDKEILKKLSLKINVEEDFFINDKDLILIGVNDDEIKSVIKLSYCDDNLNNLYLSDFNDIDEERDFVYNRFNILAFSSLDEIEELKLIFNLHQYFSGSYLNVDNCITISD